MNGTTDVALNGFAGRRKQVEGGRLEAVAILLFLHRDVQTKRRGAEGHTDEAFARLAGSAQHFDIQTKHQTIAQCLGRNIFKRNAREESAALVGLNGVDGEFRRIVVAEPPEVGISELVGSCDTGIAHRHTVVSDGFACEADAVLRPLQGGCLVHLHLEGRTLVFLHTETDVGAIGLNPIDAWQASFRQDEIGGEHAQGVRSGILVVDDLPVGIAEMQVESVVGFGLGVPVQLIVDYAAEVNRLTWAIDGTVCIEADRLGFMFLVLGGSPTPQRLFREIMILDCGARGR